MRESVVITDELVRINWSQLCVLFTLCGWDQRSPDEIRIAAERGSHVCAAFVDDQLIGFGRTVDDGRYYALLVDIVVHPTWQHMGLGEKIVTFLREKLSGFRFITLTAAPGKAGFYRKLGWKHQSSAFLWPKNHEQQVLHCFSDANETERST